MLGTFVEVKPNHLDLVCNLVNFCGFGG